MKISVKWLSDYIEISDQQPQKLAELLTRSGLEVESIEDRARDFENVVTAHILELKRHPDADRLTVCQVTTGQGVVHQIVCGATNHKEGDRVVASLPGAVLPGNFVIKKSKIRGVESQGMLCSEKELGLSQESQGILILPPDAPVGKPFAEYMGIDDVVFEIKVTPNRADCLSHFGLAREVATLLGRDFHLPFKPFEEDRTRSTQAEVRVEVKDSELCPRYAGRSIYGVKVGESPAWLKRRLESVGLKSINNIVDVTNFVMMELGQPLHAFDLAQLRGPAVIVDRARVGEKFTTLDGTELTLDGSELMIRDSERPIAMAGVIGGKESGVYNSTQDLFIESAYFRPSGVRKTSRKFGIETDAGYRFSRGVDPDAALLALNRACELISQVAGGKVSSSPYDVYPAPIQKDRILVSLADISDRLGAKVDKDKFATWMKRLGCRIEEATPGEFQVLPPLYRSDLSLSVDLIEEYARLEGYDLIPETMPEVAIAPTPHAQEYVLGERVSKLLRGVGFQEVVNFSFVSSQEQKRILGELSKLKRAGLESAADPVAIKNPLNEDFDVMRTSLVPGLLKNASYNCRMGNQSGRFFEIGYTFERLEVGFDEEWRLSLVMWGEPGGLWEKSKSPLVLTLKSQVEALLAGLNARSWRWDQTYEAPDFAHPGQTAHLFYEGKTLGFVASVHPKVCSQLDMRVPVAVAEFELSKLLQGQPRVVRAKTPAKFPVVERDLAFVMPRSMPTSQVTQEIQKAAGPLLASVEVFDVFEGGNLAEDQKSVAFRMQFQSSEATLSEEEIQKLHTTLINAVSQKLSIQIR